MDDILAALRERAKELNCLYAVEEILAEPDIEPEEACQRLIDVIPPGWQYPAVCHARISLHDRLFETRDFRETPWMQRAVIRVQDRRIGSVEVAYAERLPTGDDGPFLQEEARLIATIAERIGNFVQHHAMRLHHKEWKTAKESLKLQNYGGWHIVLDLLSTTDSDLYTRVTHKMLNHLCSSGVAEAEALLERTSGKAQGEAEYLGSDANRPERTTRMQFTAEFANETFSIAQRHLSDELILVFLRRWMQEDRLSFLFRAVQRDQSLATVADAIRRYQRSALMTAGLSRPARARLRVSLIRRFLSDQLDYIRIAKAYFSIRSFHDILDRIVYTKESHGRLGGKAAGMYLAARILEQEGDSNPDIGQVKIPKTWHITSDLQRRFIHHNNLDELEDQKYKDVGQVRFEYPHIIATCKNSRLPPEFLQGLSALLDDVGDVPLVVRSSSVLEDRAGAAFSGKYKSLFVGNCGSAKKDRLEDLCDAIVEVYASMFGPDPIEYRAERGLLDFSEEMGIIIQEVVGQRVGPYFFPAFAGVALSRNEFRWSPRIHREDGLVRMVPGLGTRSVDRIGDDYPILFAPGQPNLRVNVTTDEMARYSPRYVDVVNLETNSFETVHIADLIQQFGMQLPLAPQIVSVNEGGRLRPLSLSDVDVPSEDLVVTFAGLLSDRRFVPKAQAILRVLEEKMESPVDVEFAHDGKDLYLLQCRTQSDSELSAPARIPADVAPARVVFTANKYVSNGYMPDITHVVYVDPDRYARLSDLKDLRKVGRAVGRLNKVLPKRQFILMGPGRWGSRGDIKLGVSVGYSDINNTAALVEIARRAGQSTPDLSFGTHFFQDLAEAGIRYLPLYPDEPGNVFNEEFLAGSPSVLEELAPEFAHLADTVRVIDVPAVTGGLVLRVLLNAELDHALAMLGKAQGQPSAGARLPAAAPKPTRDSGSHWQWRMLMVEQIAQQLDPARFGVKGLYVFGSTKNETARPSSDINVLVHFTGDAAQRERLQHWLEGWSRGLDEMNFLRTGCRTGGLLDVHYVSDEDVEAGTGYAGKIDAITDAARPLSMGGSEELRPD